MGECGCQDYQKDHSFLEIPNYDKLLFIEHWMYCEECGNPEGYDIQLISKKEFELTYKDDGYKIEGRVREEDCLWNKKHHKDEKVLFITFKDFFPRIKELLEDFGKDCRENDYYETTEEEDKAMSKINWKEFANAFERHLLENCPKKRVTKL